MKKFFTMIIALGAIFSFTACSDDDNTKNQQNEESYSLTATPLDGSQFTAFEDSEARFSLNEDTEAGDGTMILLMEQVKFVEQMPRITIDAPGITLDAKGEFTASALVPRFNGTEMAQYTLANFTLKADYNKGTLKVSFDCFTMHVEYEGTLK